METKTIPIHKQLSLRIKATGMQKKIIAKALGMSRPTFDRFLKTGLFCDVGQREPHGLSAKQLVIVQKYL